MRECANAKMCECFVLSVLVDELKLETRNLKLAGRLLQHYPVFVFVKRI